MGPIATGGSGAVRLSSQLLAGLALVFSCSLLYFSGRLGWGLWKTVATRRQAKFVTLTAEAERSWNRYRNAFGIDEAQLATSSGISGPVTVGIRRGVLLTPPEFLAGVDENDLYAMFAHEFAHMRRHDFAKNLFYELLALPVAYHPILWLTRSRLAETREMVCDAMAAEAVAGTERYARSLLRLASTIVNPSTRTLHAIGIFDANILERRIMNLTNRKAETRGVLRAAIAGACAVLALAACGTALALRINVATPAVLATDQTDNHAKPKVSAGIMAGQRTAGTNPVYPPQAKADRVQGAVILGVTINEEGEAVDVYVKTGVRDDLDESALTAVRTWRWKPYLLNGNPTAVETTVTVNYSLGAR
jgi:TonB family protein